MLWDAPQATRRPDASGVPVRRDGGGPKDLERGARGGRCPCLAGADAPAKYRVWRTHQTGPFDSAQRALGGLGMKGGERDDEEAAGDVAR
jgi:hypothetical protein